MVLLFQKIIFLLLSLVLRLRAARQWSVALNSQAVIKDDTAPIYSD